jgi:hypothetical protein
VNYEILKEIFLEYEILTNFGTLINRKRKLELEKRYVWLKWILLIK